MVRNTKQIFLKDTDVISASEIGQFQYCSISWYLQKCGYEPQTHLLGIGADKHIQLGDVIDDAKRYSKISKKFATIGYVLIVILILIILLGVILF